MIVVSDTSPLCYLILIEQIELLPRLYGSVVIPTAVHQELLAVGAPAKVKAWMGEIPDWLKIQALTMPSAVELGTLDRGEHEAIALAEQLGAELILLDEQAGRAAAQARGLAFIGILGILGTAANQGWIDFETVLNQLLETNFWVSPKLVERLLERYGRSK